MGRYSIYNIPAERRGPLLWQFIRRASIDHYNLEGCWEWTGADKGNGYGHTHYGTAHRAIWSLINEPAPKNMDVCHKCDNRRCVNPSHLFLGSRLDNMRDCKAKGRTARGEALNPRKGENGPAAKLTWQQVKEIRSSPESRRSLSIKYNTDISNIGLIQRGLTWKEPENAGN